MAKTRTQLEDLIADDLARSDLSTQISDSVEVAIKAYQEESFWFNTAYRVTATLSSSTAFIDLSIFPTVFYRFDRVRVVLSSGNDLDLIERDYDWVMSRQDVVSFTIPCEYCLYDEKMQFDNYAQSNLTFYFDGIKSLGNATSNSYSIGDTSAWFNEARELIRHRAKRELYMHTIKDSDMAGVAKLAEDDAFNTLKSKTNQRASTGFLRPTEF